MEISEFIKSKTKISDGIKKILKNKHTDNDLRKAHKIILEKYLINAHDSPKTISNIISQEECNIKLSLLTNGLSILFKDCYVYGKIIYDVLIGKEIDDTCNKFYIVPTTIHAKSLFSRYITLSDENEKTLTYTLDQEDMTQFIVSKKVSEFITEIVFDDKNSINIYMFNSSIYMHPFYQMTVVQNMFIENDNSIEHVMSILCDDFKKFKESITNTKLNNETIDALYKICINFDKYEWVEFLLHGKWNSQNDIIFQIIKCNKDKYIELLLKNNININVLNVDGLTPIEYAMDLNHKQLTDSKIVVQLNNYKYIRNPKWWDAMHNYKIYNLESNDDYDKSILDDIRTWKLKTVRQLNNCIVRNMIKYNMFMELREFVKHNINFMNMNKILDDIKNSHRSDIINYLEGIISVTPKLIYTYFDMFLYDKLLNVKDALINNMDNILVYLISSCNIKGLVFIFEYIDKSAPSKIYNFDYAINDTLLREQRNTLLHILCSINFTEKNLSDINNCCKVLLNYYPEALNIKDSDGNIPIFLCNKSNYLNELMLITNMDITNEYRNNLGDNYLHNIIRSGTIDVLNKAISYGIFNDHNLVNEINGDHETPLMLACKLKKQDFCNILINIGADMNCCDTMGNTIYHYICLYGLSDVKVNNIPEIKNKLGHTPTDYIIKNMITFV